MSVESWSLLALAVALIAVLVGAQELGRRTGRRWAEVKEQAGIGAIEASVLALLGLFLAFQMARAGGRLDVRRELIVREANAIRTAYLRLDLLAAEQRSELRELFRRYADSRIRFQEAMPNIQAARDADADSTKIQGEIWTKAVAACRQETGPPAMLLLPALNQMIDVTAEGRVAALTHAPTPMLLLVVVVAVLSAFLGGFGMAAAPKRPMLHMLAFAFVTGITMCMILDLEYPRIGLIRIGTADQALLDARQSMD